MKKRKKRKKKKRKRRLIKKDYIEFTERIEKEEKKIEKKRRDKIITSDRYLSVPCMREQCVVCVSSTWQKFEHNANQKGTPES